jgi:membrane protease YdiL (CAAX protease family)
MANISAAILGRSALENDWILTNPARKLTFICAVLIVPVAEELIYRGAILGSLLERTSVLWAVAITVAGATVMHDSWLTAFPGQVFLCTAYLIRRRSIPASIIAHATANAAIFAPSLLIVFHTK